MYGVCVLLGLKFATMIFTNTVTLEQKISDLENVYAEQFERNASVETLDRIWQKIRFLQSLLITGQG